MLKKFVKNSLLGSEMHKQLIQINEKIMFSTILN